MSFGGQVDRWAGRTQEKIDAAYRKIFFDIVRIVVLRTPVQDGFLVGGWQPSGYRPILFDNNLADRSGAIVNDKAKRVGMDADAKVPLFLSNNKPYAYAIEFLGHSGQRPEGMMRTTVDEYQAVVKAVARQLR